MKQRIYLETSVVSYLVGRLSHDVVVLGNQELTRNWWANRRSDYEIYVSEIVLREVAVGDTALAAQRLAIVEELPLLAITETSGTPGAVVSLSGGSLAERGNRRAAHVARSCSWHGLLVIVELSSYRERGDSASYRTSMQNLGV